MATSRKRGERWTEDERNDLAVAALMGTMTKGGTPYPTVIPPSQWPELVAMYERRASFDDMARHFGVSTRTVRRLIARLWAAAPPEQKALLQRRRFPKRRRQQAPQQPREPVLSARACYALALARDGKTAQEAAQASGYSANWVRELARTAGVPLARPKRVSKQEATQALYEAVESTLPRLYGLVPEHELTPLVEALELLDRTRRRRAA